jgi:hypothetical protein
VHLNRLMYSLFLPRQDGAVHHSFRTADSKDSSAGRSALWSCSSPLRPSTDRLIGTSLERFLFVVELYSRNIFVEALDVLPAGLRGGGCELSAFGKIAVWCISRTEEYVQNASGLSVNGRTTAILKVVRSQGINGHHSSYPHSMGQRSPSPTK